MRSDEGHYAGFEESTELHVVKPPRPYFSGQVVIKSNDKIDSAKIISHCKSNLAGYKVPKVVHFRGSLPKDLQGKILKRILRDELNVP